MKKLKETAGSYTVEAALIIPIFLFLLFGGVSHGIRLYTEIREEVSAAEDKRDTVAPETALIRKAEALTQLEKSVAFKSGRKGS